MKKLGSSSQIKMGSLLSYIQMALSMGIGIIYTPFMIRMLGQSEYGLYNTVASTIGTLSILNLEFGTGYIRYYAKYKAENNHEKIDSLNGFFLLLFLGIGAIALFSGVMMTVNLEKIFADGITQAEYGTARILMILMTANMALSFPMSVFGVIISANERYIFKKMLSMVNTVLSPLLNLPLLLLGYKSVGLVVVMVGLAVISDLIKIYYVIVVLKQKFVFKHFEKGLFTGLFVYTVFIAMNTVIDQINWNIDKLLLARFKGMAAVAIYSVGFSLYNYYMMFSTAISGVFTPRIHKIVNETKNDLVKQRMLLTNLFTKVGRIQFLILGLIASGVVFFGKPFILNFWAGDGYEDSYYVAILLIITSSIALIQNLGIEIQRAKNIHQFRSIAYMIMAIVNLGMSIYLCQIYGPIGSAFGTAVSLVLANGLIMNIFYHKRCEINIISFWRSIGGLAKGMVFPVIMGMIIVRYVDLNSIPMFFSFVAIYTLVYCVSQWILGMNEYEKSLITKPLEKIMHRG